MAKMKDCSNCGKLMVMIGLLVIAPVAILPFYPLDMDYAVFFLLSGLLSVLSGGLVCAFGKREAYFSSDRLTAQRHSNNTVLFTWFWGIAVGAMPFFLSGQLRVVQSLFESVSGWTTTGLSVMDVTKTSHIFLFGRGGIGIFGSRKTGSICGVSSPVDIRQALSEGGIQYPSPNGIGAKSDCCTSSFSPLLFYIATPSQAIDTHSQCNIIQESKMQTPIKPPA